MPSNVGEPVGELVAELSAEFASAAVEDCTVDVLGVVVVAASEAT